MKIISKFKDYYDHEVSYFGFDPTRIYDRRSSDIISGTRIFTNTQFYFMICGKIYPVVKYKDKFYFEYHDDLNGSWFRVDNMMRHFKWREFATNLNLKFRQPVLFSNYYNHIGHIEIPQLSSFGFPSQMSSREIYQKIYDFIGFLKDNPTIPNNQTSKEKVVSHGFDVRTSFRPKIKK